MTISRPVVGAVLGSPISHSLSPSLYRAAFSELGINGDYIAIECVEENVADTLNQLRRDGVQALSVTMPLKEAIIPFLDEVDSNAQLLNAVNCVSFIDGVAVGHNTDGDGCCDALEEQGGAELKGARVVVVGAGGTARSVALALGRRGAHISVMNRSLDNALYLVGRLNEDIEAHGGSITLGGVGDIESASVLINTTSVGMNTVATPVASEYLHSGLVVLDAVYQPMATTLLRDAGAAGATTIDGLWMLIQQARRQCVLQFGRKPSVIAMRAAAEHELSQRRK